MATLTDVAQITRRLIIFILFVSVLGIFLFFIYSALKNTFKTIQPVPPPNFITTFGKLPEITFPKQTFPSDIKFNIETISGRLPQASISAKVYFLPKKQLGLLTNIKTDQTAKKLGFNVKGQSVNKKTVFRDGQKELIIDPVTENFTYKYDYQNDGTVFEGSKELTESEVISISNLFLNSIAAIPNDYNKEPQVTFLTYNGAEFIPTIGEEDQKNATSAKVSYFRNQVDKLNVVTEKFNEGNIYVIVSKAIDKNRQVIEANKFYQEISLENMGLYPIKDSNLAWQDFLNGKGYIINAGNSTFTKRAIIRDSYLAYLEKQEEQNYLIPIYVFTGDEGFIAYANAISDDWVIK